MHREARTEPPVRVLQATFRDVGSAHRAVEALERAGVDGQAIVLRDPAASQARDPRHTRALDARGMHRFGGGIVRGGVAGGLVGAVLGAAVALVLSGPLPWGRAGGLSALGLGGLALGVYVGTLVGAARNAGFSDAWELTFADVPAAPVVVEVRAVSPRTVRTARPVLRSLGGETVPAATPPGTSG